LPDGQSINCQLYIASKLTFTDMMHTR